MRKEGVKPSKNFVEEKGIAPREFLDAIMLHLVANLPGQERFVTPRPQMNMIQTNANVDAQLQLIRDVMDEEMEVATQQRNAEAKAAKKSAKR